jgi:transposase
VPAEIIRLSRGYTVVEVARRFRVGRDRVREWIVRGELEALDTADPHTGRPRYVVTAEALERFERSRSAARPKPQPRQRRRVVPLDYFPDL